MTAGAQILTAGSQSDSGASPVADAARIPAGWKQIRDDNDLQFAPVDIPDIQPREPSWFLEMLDTIFTFLGDVFAAVGQLLGISWGLLQWVLLGLAVAFALYLARRTFGEALMHRRSKGQNPARDAGWRPDTADSLALLEDADRLAAEGRYDEATRLLLQRSVGQIAAAQPDWVEPSSTARELAALPALPNAARTAFRVIAERVERSLFALRALDRADWEAARSAYADFALVPISAGRHSGEMA